MSHLDPPQAPTNIRKIDLGQSIRHLCETEWILAGGLLDRLVLCLDSVFLQSSRVILLCEATRHIIHSALGPGFSPRWHCLGVHIWRPDSLEAILLMADDRDRFVGEPLTLGAARARVLADQANCRLIWVPARGAVWRIHIPME